MNTYRVEEKTLSYTIERDALGNIMKESGENPEVFELDFTQLPAKIQVLQELGVIDIEPNRDWAIIRGDDNLMAFYIIMAEFKPIYKVERL